MDHNIKSFEDACVSLGIQPAVPDFSNTPEQHRKAFEAHYKLVIIAEALNQGWQPNWSDPHQLKYYPWFEVKANEDNPAGFGFWYTDYDCDLTRTAVGSRLCFKSSELALYAGKQFEDLSKEYFLFLK